MTLSHKQFSLRELFLWVTLAGALLGAVLWALNRAKYAAVQSSYGGQRMTREQAREIRPNDDWIDLLPDSEFLPAPGGGGDHGRGRGLARRGP